MRIKHRSASVHRVSHDGSEYETLGEGIFDVREDHGRSMVRFPEWEEYFGELPEAPRRAPVPDLTEDDKDASAHEARPARSRRQD